MLLSIVTTLYRSGTTIEEFYRRVIAAAEPLAPKIELIFVNDGSPDDSRERALALQRQDPRIVVVDLARNFGHHKAMMTGLMHAGGDLVFLVDSDLEEEPELLTAFHCRLMKGDCDVVYGVQESRRGGWFERATGELYFLLLNALTDDAIPRNVVTARLMTKAYVQSLVRFRDREFVISQLWVAAGFRQVAAPVKKHEKTKTTYSIFKRINLAARHLTTASTRLLYLMFYLGLMISFFSGAWIIWLITRYLAADIGVDGWTTLIVSTWFFGGLITLFLGILGIYIANILSESKQRPYTVVRHVYPSHQGMRDSEDPGMLGEANRESHRSR